MAVLPPVEVEAQLSYAYLHAVAAMAGMSCDVSSRPVDNLGIDATIRASAPFPPGAVLTEVNLDVQLKATARNPALRDGRFSYWLDEVRLYDRLRAETVAVPRILVVLFLPSDRTEWLRCTSEELALRKCAWWVSLRGAPESDNRSGQTVYLPERQALSPSSLQDIVSRLSREEDIRYEG